MKRIQLIAGMSAILFLAAGISVAAVPGHAGAQKPKAVKAPHATHGSQAMSGKSPKPPKPPTKVSKSTNAAKTLKPAKTTTKTAKATAKPSVTSSPAAAMALTPVQAKLQKNTNLAAKLTSRLPAGTDLMTASAGFRNLGQFVAAVNVSNNLGIPFAQLKAKMVTDGLTLGQTIQALRPAASATVEAQRAEYDARGMIAESPQPTTTTVPTKVKPKAKKVHRTQIGS